MFRARRGYGGLQCVARPGSGAERGEYVVGRIAERFPGGSEFASGFPVTILAGALAFP